MAAGGTDGDHLTLLVSDHGLSRIERHVDLAVAFERHGSAVLRHPMHLWRRDPAVAVMVSGNASAQIYLVPNTPRAFRQDLSAIEAGQAGVSGEIVQWMAQLPGIAMVVATEGNDVVVVSANGRARLSMDVANRIRYAPAFGDPLLLGGGAERHEREWLALSHDGAFPDAPTQLMQLFRAQRTGDLVVIAAPGTDLREEWEYPEHHAGHGSLHGDHMRCLVASNHRLQCPLRTVDLFVTTLLHLGHPIPENIDGVAT